MNNHRRCLDCGAELDGQVLSGLCPRCLLNLIELSQGDAADPAVEESVSFDHTCGDILGRYRLVEKIGEGGFGAVWKAEQMEPVQRLVALKLIKLGMDTREVIARFEAERQALAMMDHPGIAKVFDAGATASGRPYFVMELVEGVPITRYSREQRLDLKARLNLFVEVCAAVQHAHQKGIIHRDLKPSNILVGPSAESGQRPTLKVIDFGVAKAIEGRLTDASLMTRLGQFVGTPVYMSPEQARAGGVEVDTRSDIYSLGVLLYELLAGVPPFDPKALIGSGFEEMCRIIREEEPPKPSTRLQTTSQTRSLPGDVHCDHRALRGDLDWIVMKALEKDRSRRYETVSGFSRDLQRYLNNEPVSAAAPGAVYRLRKFVRRNRTAVGMSAVVSVLFLGGFTGTTWFALRDKAQSEALGVKEKALGEARRAQAAEAVAKERAEFFHYVHLIELAYQQWKDGNSVRAAELLDQCPPRERAWEWYYLNSLVYPSPLASFQASPEPVERGFHDPVTQNLYVLTESGDVLVRKLTWDPANVWHLLAVDQPVPDWVDKLLRRTDDEGTPGTHWPGSLAAKVDGGIVAISRVRLVWERHYGVGLSGSNPDQWIRRDASAVTCLALNLRGDRLISGARDGTLKLWESGDPRSNAAPRWLGEAVLNARPIRQYRGHSAEVVHLHFIDVHEAFFCTLATDGSLKIWPATGFQVMEGSDFPETSTEEKRDGLEKEKRSLDFSPDGRKLAVLDYSEVFCYDISSGKLIWRSKSLGGMRLQFNRVGDMVAVAEVGATAGAAMVRTLDAESGDPIHEFAQSSVWSMAFDPQGRLVAPSDGRGRGGKVIRWNLSGDPESTVLLEHADGFSSVAISPNGKLLAAARTSWINGTEKTLALGEGQEERDESVIVVWDLERGAVFAELTTRFTCIWQLAFSPDGKWLASGAGPYNGSGFGEVKLWDLEARKEKFNYPVDDTCIFALAFTPDGERLAAAGKPAQTTGGEYRSTVTMWDLQEGIEVFRLRGDDTAIHELSFSPDGSCLAAANKKGGVRMWAAPGAGGGSMAERIGNGWKGGQQSVALPEPKDCLIHPFSEWRWLHPTDGSDPETRLPGFHQGFSRLDFDDSAWPSGQDSPSLDGGFGYEPTGDKQFPGVDIGCPEEGQHYTAYFRCRFTTTEDAEDLELRCRMEDWMQEGIIVYLDGVEVVRDRVEDGADAYHLRAIDSEGFESRYIQRYPISGTLTAGDHVLAISLHSLAPTGYQRSLHIAGITLTASTGEPEE